MIMPYLTGSVEIFFILGGITMSLSLRNIYKETRQRYQLELICGESGLDRLMSWVYISEDLTTSEFLQDGELVISTGIISRHNPGWLEDFVRVLIDHGICGLILNIGPYVKTEDITPEIRTLCDTSCFPIFTMPWQVRIYDITHDYYNRIFLDSQNETAIVQAFSDLLRRHDMDCCLSTLNTYGFPTVQSYTVACMIFPVLSEKNTQGKNALPLFSAASICERFLKEVYTSFQFFRYRETFLLIAAEDSLNHFREVLSSLCTEWKRYFPDDPFYAGIGSLSSALPEIPRSYEHALAALSMAQQQNTHLLSFEDLGFLKLLLSIHDNSILKSYADEHLGALISYDRAHKSNYLETLHQYLICDGSIQKIADALYCHRNTVNYRVQILKQEFGYNLDDSHAKFELTAAFEVLEFLKNLKISPS